ncbi:serine O-acetyltransferase [Deinococcus cellulosilyticus]|uniref:serine O-acetyltransferase n=1 Tax=Deinococcus cellulosilyticus TaxID=401558 RepID=UPI001C98EEFF|nr:serine O-acetyltransferase [Deinococcus cellulosilyticus]
MATLLHNSVQARTLWSELQHAAQQLSESEKVLGRLLKSVFLTSENLAEGLSVLLSGKLSTEEVCAEDLRAEFVQVLSDPEVLGGVVADLQAIRERDPAVKDLLTPFLFFKGFHALQTHRIAHRLWTTGRQAFALFLQSQMSLRFAVDIHPAAHLGQGILMDHATGVVIGETAVVDDNVSMLHGVTLGGTGKQCCDRHPKIRSGVLIGAGATVLGNIEIGKDAKVAAGSVVLKPVHAHTTVAGVPAKVMARNVKFTPALEMNHEFDIHI